MHEPPVARGIAIGLTARPQWAEAIERYRPCLVVSGHDHNTPLFGGVWRTRIGESVVVNAGQDSEKLWFCVAEISVSGNGVARLDSIRRH
ncbi:MAG: hypothetical protein ACFUZC_18745 [Chthoniobacteraceae bacterium]